MAIPRDLRLKKNKDFQAVKKEGTRRVYPYFIAQLRHPRKGAVDSKAKTSLGIIAARRVGNAVVRNRGKRLMRNLFLKYMDVLPAGSQLVIVLRLGFQNEPLARLEKDFLNACNWFKQNAAEK